MKKSFKINLIEIIVMIVVLALLVVGIIVINVKMRREKNLASVTTDNLKNETNKIEISDGNIGNKDGNSVLDDDSVTNIEIERKTTNETQEEKIEDDQTDSLYNDEYNDENSYSEAIRDFGAAANEFYINEDVFFAEEVEDEDESILDE